MFIFEDVCDLLQVS